MRGSVVVAGVEIRAVVGLMSGYIAVRYRLHSVYVAVTLLLNGAAIAVTYPEQSVGSVGCLYAPARSSRPKSGYVAVT